MPGFQPELTGVQRIACFFLLNLQMMKKAIAIFFLFVFASATTEFGQLLKLPVLVQHFYTHQQQESMSLTGFIAEHYIGYHEDEDRNKDMELPFKTTISGPSITAHIQVARIEVNLPEVRSPELNTPLKKEKLPTQLLPGIFHPPRIV